MLDNTLIFLLNFGLYNIWLVTLALNFMSSLVLLSNYTNSQGTPIGRSAFYFFLTSFLWSVTSTIITIPIFRQNEYSVNYFYTSIMLLAAIALSLGTYERARIQMLLTPGAIQQTRDNRLLFILSVCTVGIALIGLVGNILNNPTLNILFPGMSVLTNLGFILIGGLFIALTQPKFRYKLAYVGSAILLIMGFTLIMIELLGVYAPFSPLLLGPEEVPIAVVFIIASLWIAIAKRARQRLRWWMARIVMAMAILSSVAIQSAAYFLHHPAIPSIPVLLLMVLAGGAMLWRSWKVPM